MMTTIFAGLLQVPVPQEPVPSSFYWDLLGVGIGAFAGFVFGIMSEKLAQKWEDKRKRATTINLLKTELLDNKSVLKAQSKIIWNDKTFEMTYPTFTTASYDNAISTGTLALLEPKTQLAIWNIYSRFNGFNESVNHLFHFLASTNSLSTDGQEIIRRFEKILNERASTISCELEKILKLLETKRNNCEEDKQSKHN